MAVNPSMLRGSFYFPDGISVGEFLDAPAGAIKNTHFSSSSGDRLAAAKAVHQFPLTYCQAPGSAVVAATVDWHAVYGATGSLLSLEAAITGTIATGADRTVTIDLLKSTAAGAFSTVLSSTIVLDNTSVLRTLEAAAFSDDDVVDGDLLRLTVAVAGAAGSQALGLLVRLMMTEDPS